MTPHAPTRPTHAGARCIAPTALANARTNTPARKIRRARATGAVHWAAVLLLVGLAALLFFFSGADIFPARAPAATQTTTALALHEPAAPPRATTGRAAYPAEARAVIERIQRGEAHPYAKDGTTFFNREGKLPQKPRGYYREYTVPTPGARNRGARRLITGGDPPEVWYYTADHYQSFQRITP